jgi:hypothetical protein
MSPQTRQKPLAGFLYALDNGAWSAYQQKREFDFVGFERSLRVLGAGADWVVLPDIVAGGSASLSLSQFLGLTEFLGVLRRLYWLCRMECALRMCGRTSGRELEYLLEAALIGSFRRWRLGAASRGSGVAGSTLGG